MTRGEDAVREGLDERDERGLGALARRVGALRSRVEPGTRKAGCGITGEMSGAVLHHVSGLDSWRRGWPLALARFRVDASVSETDRQTPAPDDIQARGPIPHRLPHRPGDARALISSETSSRQLTSLGINPSCPLLPPAVCGVWPI
jgi:hypothetical protein